MYPSWKLLWSHRWVELGLLLVLSVLVSLLVSASSIRRLMASLARRYLHFLVSWHRFGVVWIALEGPLEGPLKLEKVQVQEIARALYLKAHSC